MHTTWWTYTFDPTAREVAIQRWEQRSSLRKVLVVEYGGLTWAEAVDVLDSDAWAVIGQAVHDLR